MNFSKTKSYSAFMGFLTHNKSAYNSVSFYEFTDTFESTCGFTEANLEVFTFSKNLFHRVDVPTSHQIKSVYGLMLARHRYRYYIREKRKESFVFFAIALFESTKTLKNVFIKTWRDQKSKNCIRMANMTLGHLSILEKFVKSNKDFAIIFEDDSDFHSPKEQAVALDKLLHHLSAKRNLPLFANISDSFSLGQLEANQLIGDKGWLFGNLKVGKQILYSMKKPITNTTCVVVYTQSFARLIIDNAKSIQSQSSYMYLPFDWLFNLILIKLFRSGIPIKCFHNEPGLFKQGSIHSPKSL